MDWVPDIGETVILGRHTLVNNARNWSQFMESFVGTRAVVTRNDLHDGSGPVVEVVGNQWRWRVLNLKPYVQEYQIFW